MPFLPVITSLIFATMVLAKAAPITAQTLVVHIDGIRATTGAIRIGFYDSAEQWGTEKSNFQRHGYKQELRNGRLTLTFNDVPPGHYSAAIVDDENDSGGMDWGFLLPKEGFGFSNYVHKGLFRPDFEDFDFDLAPFGKTVITFRVRYL